MADLFDVYTKRFVIWKGPRVSDELAAGLNMARAILARLCDGHGVGDQPHGSRPAAPG
ncbi:hypothetical protein ACN24M_01415 [Streptomyces microflavus]|uniref:hypothetical protein n=1 Tax=Streptomyces microflavus TaxID=1919 RepID=UPI003B21E66F